MKRLFTLTAAAIALAFAAGTVNAGEKLRIGTEGAYPPFNAIDSSGNLIGFDVDVAKALCKAADFDCEFVVQDWDGMIPGLLAKKYDAIIASMSITEERLETVDFTNKYYSTPAKFVAKEGANIEISAEGLAGKTIGVQGATTHENFVHDNFPDADIRSYKTQDEANQDLVSGRVDLVIADSVALDDGFLSTDSGKGHVFIGPGYTDPKWFGNGVGIAIRKGSDDLRMKLNAAIDQIRADGTYKKIQDQYFDFDVYGEPTS